MSDIEGTDFAGYRIDAVAGRGGMGVVYRATQLDLHRTVALKVIATELLEDATARRRFVQESQLAASIDHPHVIPIHAAGVHDGVPFIAMRYVSDDVRALVRREGALPPERAARIVGQVADALDAAHAAGLVHRDVKPANVLLADDDHVYLSDFGLTRHVRSLSGPTDAGQWVGTLDYVAPEQIRGGDVDARTDVYALGCLLFHLLTGTVPFPREGDEARLWAHLTERPPTVGPDVPAAFDAVIARALAKAPDDRYPSAGDLGRAAAAAATGTSVRRAERAVARGDAAPVETPTRTSQPVRRRSSRAPALVALVVAVAAAVVVFLALDTGDAPAPPARAEASPSPAPARPRVVARIPVGARPNALARVGDRLWVGSFDSTLLDAIDADAGRRVRALRPDVGGGVADLATARGRLWVATRGNQMHRLDPVSGRPLGPPIALPMEPVVVAARGGDVVTGVESDEGNVRFAQLIRLDASTGAVRAVVRVAHGMAGMVYARGWLWTLHGGPNFIIRRDPRTLRAHKRINLPGKTAGALAYGARALWATIPDQDQLVRYQPGSQERPTVEVGARPVGVGVRDGTVWVALNGSSTLVRVDAGEMRRIGAPIRTPLNPYTLAVARDGIWLTCVGEDLVAHVDVPS